MTKVRVHAESWVLDAEDGTLVVFTFICTSLSLSLLSNAPYLSHSKPEANAEDVIHGMSPFP